MGFIVALLGRVLDAQEVGTTVIVGWNEKIVEAWYAAVTYWYGLNGW